MFECFNMFFHNTATCECRLMGQLVRLGDFFDTKCVIYEVPKLATCRASEQEDSIGPAHLAIRVKYIDGPKSIQSVSSSPKSRE